MNGIKQGSNPSDKFGYWKRLTDWFISPPASVQEVGAKRQAQLLAAMTLVIGILNTVGVLFTPGDELNRNRSLIILSVLLFIAYGLSRTRFYFVGSWLVVIAISLAAYYLAVQPGAQTQSILLTFLPLAFALGIGLLSQLGLLILVVATTVITFVLSVLVPTVSSQDIVGAGGILMTLGALLLVVNAVQISVEKTRREDLINANKELLSLQGGLEQRVAERTKALATSAAVSRRLSTIQSQMELVNEVVNQVTNAFGYYHTQIYFYDEANENLVMAGGTGEAGEMMLAQFHKVAKGRGLVGRAAENNQAVLVSDTSQNPDWLPNALLPQTKSEAVIPISIGAEVLGVLDVQHNRVDGLKQEDLDALQSISNQVAVAVGNARSYEKLREAEKLTRDVIDSTDDWIFIKDREHRYRLVNQGYANSLHIPMADFIGKNDLELGFPEELVKGNPEKGISGFWADDRAVMDGGTPKHIPDDFVAIDGKIRVFDTVKHPLRDADNKVWGVLAFARDVSERRRLEELTRQRAERETTLNLITQKIQGTTSIEAALQIAARELGHALGNKQTLVTLESGTPTGNRQEKAND